MKNTFEHNTQSHSIDLAPDGPGNSYRIRIGDRTARAEILQAKDGRLDLLIDGRPVLAYVSSDSARRWVTVEGQTFMLTKSTGTRKNKGGHAHAAGELTAPMPGQVRAVHVSEGDAVTKGQTLLLIEAMKMEIKVQAPRDGTVRKLFVSQGQTVEREQLLMAIAGELEG